MEHNPRVDLVLPYNLESLEMLRHVRFDLALSLDKTFRATAVANSVQAPLKYGFGLSHYGTVYPLNEEAEYAFELGISDELKFKRNEKTYQEIIFELVKLPYKGEEYCVGLSEEDETFAAGFLAKNGLSDDEVLIGLNIGGGEAFAHKMWSPERCIEFVRLVRDKAGRKVMLFGAARESDAMREVHEACSSATIHSGCDNTLRQFMALLGRCDVVVTGDTLGMHLTIAQKRPVVVLFGPTCHQEIELYGRGEKIVSSIACSPCYRATCDKEPTCMDLIEPASVLEAVMRRLPSLNSQV